MKISQANKGTSEAWNEKQRKKKQRKKEKFLAQAELLVTGDFGGSMESLWDAAVSLSRHWTAVLQPEKDSSARLVPASHRAQAVTVSQRASLHVHGYRQKGGKGPAGKIAPGF